MDMRETMKRQFEELTQHDEERARIKKPTQKRREGKLFSSDDELPVSSSDRSKKSIQEEERAF